MLSNISYYTRPAKLSEAVNILFKGKGEFIIYAGGTSSLLMKNSKIKGFVSLRDLNLNFIKKTKNSIKIGAMTRIQELYESEIVNKFANGVISYTASKIGSTLNRNLITVGGNLTQVFRWSDLPVTLLVLDSKLNITGKSKKSIKITDFYLKHPKVILKPWDIVTDVEVKEPKGQYGVSFIKFSKTEFDYALIDVAVFLKISNNKISDIRIAYGSIGTLPFRLYKLEQEFKNKQITENTGNEIAEMSKRLIKPAGDFRISKDYQKKITGVITKRAFEICLEQMGIKQEA